MKLEYQNPVTSEKSAAVPSTGPFVLAVLGVLFSSGVLIALRAGMKLTLVTGLAVLIPGMTFSTMLLSVSMGWIFISIGRYRTRPRWVIATGVIIAITMLELLVLTFLANAGGKLE